MKDIILIIMMVISMFIYFIGLIIILRSLVTIFRVKGNISDKQAEKYNLPFSKHFKLKLNLGEDRE